MLKDDGTGKTTGDCAVETALIQQDIGYIKESIEAMRLEMKETLRDFKESCKECQTAGAAVSDRVLVLETKIGGKDGISARLSAAEDDLGNIKIESAKLGALIGFGVTLAGFLGLEGLKAFLLSR